ncbi:MAG TPA: hypothetical protein VJP80_01700 [Candidatus Saccharimonadales bacterium]|nr:hypothetical protein [Candidatus Saccharimonadales bacterium]
MRQAEMNTGIFVKLLIAAVLILANPSVVFAGNLPQSYSDAKTLWQQHRDTSEYQIYASEFSQFNNHFHLDERGGCYFLAPGSVNLMLVITHQKNNKFAVIEQVFADVDNAKARCFEKSYLGISTKIPPYLPFVLQMGMG